jgi:hypothetical protein
VPLSRLPAAQPPTVPAAPPCRPSPHPQLSGLARDAAWLESYIAGAMLVVKEAVQAAALCLGPTKQPLPTHRKALAAGVRHGAVADNAPLIAELAPVGWVSCPAAGLATPAGAAAARRL